MTSSLILIGLVSLIASFLTFFSGFGLGTLLLPVFTLFFPVEIAIGLTGIVHLLNNIFKTLLIGNKINWKVSSQFGIPSVIGAIIGSLTLIYIVDIFSAFSYNIYNYELNTSLLKIVMGILIFSFTMLELIPNKKPFDNNLKNTITGGMLSGFFGGISGHQGAIRTLFLVRYNLSKESFIATGISIALAIDLTRLPIYFSNYKTHKINDYHDLILIAIISAFTGAIIGKITLNKIRLNILHRIISFCLIIFSILFSTGII